MRVWCKLQNSSYLPGGPKRTVHFQFTISMQNAIVRNEVVFSKVFIELNRIKICDAVLYN